jgi:hypothetical protein
MALAPDPTGLGVDALMTLLAANWACAGRHNRVRIESEENTKVTEVVWSE